MRRRLPRRSVTALLVSTALVASTWLGASSAGAARSSQAAASRPAVVAIGDIHGDLSAFVAILQKTGFLDADRRWTGGTTTLVQTGDMIDRGPESRGVMDLVMRLQKDAARAGGRVVVLLGNHEAMNIYGDWRYVVAADYAAFADGESEHRRRTAYEAAAARGRAPDGRDAWMTAHPAGFVERMAAFAPDGRYGKWLRTLPAVAKVDDTLFVHGGISPDLGSWSIDRINAAVAGDLGTFDRAKAFLVKNRYALPTDLLLELAGTAGVPASTRSADVRRFRDFDHWVTMDDNGPLWYREYARWTEDEGHTKLPPILAAFGVARVVAGHTPDSGRILSRFGGRAFLIDTGMLASYFTGGRASALTIDHGTVGFVYGDGPGPGR